MLTLHHDELQAAPRIAETYPGLSAVLSEDVGPMASIALAAEEAWEAERRSVLRKARRTSVRWRTATDISRRGLRLEPAGGDAEAGTVVHAVMESLDLNAPLESLREAARAAVAAHGLQRGFAPERTEDCLSIVMRLLADPVVAAVRGAPEHHKEVPFAFPEHGRVVVGSIDLCFPLDAARTRWKVVDWKFEVPAPGTARRAAYERQLAVYAKAIVEGLTGVKPENIETELIGPYPEFPVEESHARADALLEVAPQVRPVLERLLDAGAAVPLVGAGVGEPVQVDDVEMVWPASKVALLWDMPDHVTTLQALGFRVVALSSEAADALDEAASQLSEWLGVHVTGDADADNDSTGAGAIDGNDEESP